MNALKYIVIYDTYCGWCYGAGPVFDALVASGVEVEPLHRHLFEGPQAFKMGKANGPMIKDADAHIAHLTGRVFSQRYIDNIVMSDSEILTSNYTAQAAALAHDLGAAKEFAVRARLETARYVDGVSAADRDAVVAALIAEGFEPDQADQIGNAELAAKAKKIAQRAAGLMAAVGSRGVPTMIEIRDGAMSVIDCTAYYANPEEITKRAD